MSGGIARMVGPVVTSVLYVLYGPQIVWAVIVCVISLNVFLWLAFYSRMVPLEMPTDYTTLDQSSIEMTQRSPMLIIALPDKHTSLTCI